MILIEKLKALFSGRNDKKDSGKSEVGIEVNSKEITEIDMKRYLIVCLGNVGGEYEGTRHNIGFMIGERLAYEEGVDFKSCRYGSMAKVKVKNCELLLLKPSTFMNLSGVAVRYWKDKENIPVEHILVLVDDVSLPFGVIRIREKGSDAGHNGLKNIALELGTQVYPRLKFGIGNNFPKGQQINYVLGRFPDNERKELPEKLDNAIEAIKAFCLSGAAFAMTHYNK